MEFKLHSDYKPTGDQPAAIEKLVKEFFPENAVEFFVSYYDYKNTTTIYR